MSQLVPAHGGRGLRPLLVDEKRAAEERKRAQSLPKLRVTSREKGDIVMMGIGGFTPLEGFMTHADWESVCDGMRTSAGTFWPIPITLSADAATASTLPLGGGPGRG
jgi:sulfate adenylyltransferase